jgi:hypothetical protein
MKPYWGINGLPKIEKMKPVICDIGNVAYQAMGGYPGKAFALGKGVRISR